jgi:thiol-disulfide isomerase/thioredoxin
MHRLEADMPFCPKCKYEYRSDIATCPDCDVKLVPELSEAEKQKQEPVDVELVEVADFTFDVQAEEAKVLLESHGITAVVGNAISAMIYPGMTGAKVLVPKEEEKKAREILSEA